MLKASIAPLATRLAAFLVLTASVGCMPFSAVRTVNLPAGTDLSLHVVLGPSGLTNSHPAQVSADVVRAALLADGNFVDSEIGPVVTAAAAEFGRLAPTERLQISRSGVVVHLFVEGQNMVVARVDGGRELQRSTHSLTGATAQAKPAAGGAPSAGAAPGAGAASSSGGGTRRGGAGLIVAVFDLEDASGRVAASTLAQLSGYLASKLTEEGFRIVPRNQLQSQLAAQKRESYKRCYDEACQIELGKAVAAQKSLATSLIKVAESCAISSTLYDLKSETTERAASVRTDCSEGSLMEGLDRIVRQLAQPR